MQKQPAGGDDLFARSGAANRALACVSSAFTSFKCRIPAPHKSFYFSSAPAAQGSFFTSTTGVQQPSANGGQKPVFSESRQQSVRGIKNLLRRKR
ncbi:hypothetical protein [Erwinia typographi]|uniref:hypothetical protein n=1 Tax=Erwinia typographi TaxID=371042 RepID=UPI0018DC5379|nr:hypothetical protein [Erwinia typographi]